MDIVLKTKHIIMLSKLVSKMGIKIDMKETDPTKLGGQIIMDLVTNINLAEREFYELIGSLSGYSVEAVAETPINDLIDVLSEVATKLVNFIRSSVKSTT